MTNGTVIEYGELPDLGVGIFLFVLSSASFVLYALVARSVWTISRWNAPFILIIGQVGLTSRCNSLFEVLTSAGSLAGR